MADTSTTTDRQIVIGPDEKKYSFSKNLPSDRINKYFTKKGWVLKDGKWFTASGESVKGLQKVGSPPPDTGGDVLKKRQSLDKMGQFTTDVELAGVAALPSTLGMVGGMLGRTPGAAVGGGLGEGIKDLTKSAILEQKVTPQKYVSDIAIESLKQAGLQKGGEKVGEIFFKQLNKLPHAVERKGIPLLPSDLHPNSMLMKYIEDLHSNLAPSAKIMSDFKAKRDEAILKQTAKIANGFAKFNGTSEQIGVLVRNTMHQAEKDAQMNIRKMYPNLNAQQLNKTVEMQDYIKTFRNGLAKAILKTDKPEEIVGFIRGTSKGSLEDTRVVTDFIHEIKPEVLGKVKNTLIRDMVQETLTGSKDPVMRSTTGMQKNFSGQTFKDIMDDIGQQKLKAIFSPSEYKALTEFTKNIAHVNRTQGNGMGKFMNLMFLLPFRSGVTTKAALKLTGTGLLINRTAKMLTSLEGAKLYENYIRAVGAQAPRLISLARDEMIAFNEKSDREYELEQDIAEEEYKKSLPSIGVDRSKNFGSKSWEANSLE